MKNETAKKKESSTAGVLLDPDRKSPRAAEFEDKLSALIVGQERAVRRMSGLFQIYLAGMNNPSRPIGTMLFLGPTGSGKTRVVEAASEVLLNDRHAVVKIDYVLTVCDNAKANCPYFPAKTKLIHHAFEDPYFAEGDFESRVAAFRKVRDKIATYIDTELPRELSTN